MIFTTKFAVNTKNNDHAKPRSQAIPTANTTVARPWYLPAFGGSSGLLAGPYR